MRTITKRGFIEDQQRMHKGNLRVRLHGAIPEHPTKKQGAGGVSCNTSSLAQAEGKGMEKWEGTKQYQGQPKSSAIPHKTEARPQKQGDGLPCAGWGADRSRGQRRKIEKVIIVCPNSDLFSCSRAFPTIVSSNFLRARTKNVPDLLASLQNVFFDLHTKFSDDSVKKSSSSIWPYPGEACYLCGSSLEICKTISKFAIQLLLQEVSFFFKPGSHHKSHI